MTTGMFGVPYQTSILLPSRFSVACSQVADAIGKVWYEVTNTAARAASWVTDSFLPSTARTYAIACGDPVDPPSEPSTSSANQVTSFPVATTATGPSMNHLARATAEGCATYDSLFNTHGYDAAVVCLVDGKGTLHMKRPHARSQASKVLYDGIWQPIMNDIPGTPQEAFYLNGVTRGGDLEKKAYHASIWSKMTGERYSYLDAARTSRFNSWVHSVCTRQTLTDWTTATWHPKS